MKKTFLLFTLLLMAGLVFADNIIPIRTDVSGFPDWTDTSVVGTTYLQLLLSGANTITPAMNFNEYSGITLDFNARTYGGVNAVENTVTVAISTDNGASWTDIGTRTPTSSTMSAMTQFDLNSYSGTQVRIRFIVAGTNNGVGIGIDDIKIAGTPVGAALSADPNTLSGFTYVYNNGPSVAQSIALTGSYLTSDVSVSVTSNYQIAGSESGSYGSSLSYTPSAGSVSETVYVRQIAGLAIGTGYTGTVTFSSTGASTATVSLSGSVTSPPPPDAPLATAATNVGNNSFTANWNSVSGATGYEIDVYYLTEGMNATDLIISEYIEGSSNHKYLEIYNGTGSTVDLSDYKLELFSNGAATASTSITLSGTLSHGSTVVYKNSGATLTLPAGVTATNNAAVNFNGDDAIALYKISTSSYVDIFGVIGNDPGAAWTGTGGYTTVDKTLVRKSSVTEGISTNPSGTGASAFTTLTTEWDMYTIDDVSHLGSHTMAGGSAKVYVSGYQNLDVGNVTSHNVTGLTPGTTYYYVVRAYNSYGSSDDSNEIEVTTTSTSPLITLSASALTDFTYMEGSGPSEEQNFTVSGSNLTANISLAAPTNYQISTGTGASFDANMANPLVLNQSGGSIAETTIYVRLQAGLTAGDYDNEVITASSTGADNKTVTCSGTVTEIPDPTLEVSVSSLGTFSYIFGAGPSLSIYFKTGGSYLTDDIEITAPTSYEISEDNENYSDSITLTQSGGTVAETTIYVRLKAGLTIGNYFEDLTISTTGAEEESIALNGHVLTDIIPFLYWDFNDDVPASNTNWGQTIIANYGTGELTHDFTQAYTFAGTTVNTMAGDEVAGGSFAPRGGAGGTANNGKGFVMTVDTTGLENIVMTYATRASETGFSTQSIYYSVDGGANYTLFDTLTGMNVTTWSVQTMDFSSIEDANNNPNFQVKIVLDGASTEAGNNRFDNISFFGDETTFVPVELSSFTATISAQNYITLTWVTQTETGMRGYYVYRAPANDLANAQIVSPMIESVNSSQQQTYMYQDTELYDSGIYYYWLQANDLDGSSAFHGPVSVVYSATGDNPTPEIPLVTKLHSAYPNPFNPTVFIPFSLAEDGAVSFKIYNSRGQMVKHFDLGAKTAGHHRITWDGTDYDGKALANGVYQIMMSTKNQTYQSKATLLK